jgi:hypothetical protein
MPDVTRLGPVSAWLAGGSWVQGDFSQIPLLQPEDDWDINEQGISIKQTILAGYNNGQFLTVIPKLYGPHGLNLGVLYRGCKIKQIGDMGDYCMMTLIYDQRYSNTPTTPLPQPQYGCNGGKIMQDIQLHPNFKAAAGAGTPPDENSPWSQYWDAAKKDWKSDPATGLYLDSVPSYLIGWTKFPDAATTVWTKIYYTSQPTDPLPEGQILDPGFGFGPSGCYLVTTCDQQKENAFWCRTTHFDYYPRGVPAQIFINGN